MWWLQGITTIIWAVSKTKKGLLKTKDGFMFRFYSLSETISPILAWGFMGTNSALREKCHSLKVRNKTHEMWVTSFMFGLSSLLRPR